MSTPPEPRGEASTSATPAAAPADAVLLGTVEAYRSWMMLRALRARLLIALAVLALLPLFVVVADQTVPRGLPRWLLGLTLIGWLAASGGALLGVLLLTLGRRMNRVFVAQQIERLSQIPHNLLVNALLVRHSTTLAYAGAASAAQAAEAVATHPPVERVAPADARRPWLLLGAAFVAWALYAGLSPKPVGPSLARFFGSAVEAPTATWIELIAPTSADAPHAGEALEIVIALHGRPATSVKLELLAPTASPRVVLHEYVTSAAYGAAGHYRFVLAPLEVQSDIHYCLSAGDAQQVGVIPIYAQPDVAALEVTLTPPAYTGLAEQTVQTPSFDVLAGTRATWRLRANVPVADPVFVLTGPRETRTRMLVSPEQPEIATLTMTLVESGNYQLLFNDRWGVPYRDPPTHAITVYADAPPTISLVAPELPAGDAQVDITVYPELAAEALDDFGISRLVLVTEDASGLRLPVPVEVSEIADGARGTIATDLLPVTAPRPLRVWFEAADTRVLPDGTPAPQTVTSDVLTLTRPAPRRRPTPTTGPATSVDAPESSPEAPPQQKQRQRAGPTPTTNPSNASGNGNSAGTPDGRGPAQPNPDQSGAKAEPTSQPTSQPSGPRARQQKAAPTNTPTSQPGVSTGPHGDARAPSATQPAPTGATSQPSASGTPNPTQEAQRAMKEFIERHGEDAAKVAGKMKEKADQRETPSPDGQRQKDQTGKPDDGTSSEEQKQDVTPKHEGDSNAAHEPSSSRSKRGRGHGDSPDGGSQQADPEGQPSDQGAEGSGAGDQPQAPSGGSGQQGEAPGQRPPTPSRDAPPSDASNNAAGTQSGSGQGQPEGASQGASPPDAPQESSAPGSGTPGGSGTGDQSAKTPRAGTPPTAGTPERPKGPAEEPPAAPPDGAAAGAGEVQPGDGRNATEELLRQIERGAALSEDDYVDAGLTPEQARAFAEALERLRAVLAAAGGLDDIERYETELSGGDARLLQGQAAHSEADLTAPDLDELSEGLRRIAPPPEQDVPQRLAPLLEAYYRSLARQRANTERTGPPRKSAREQP